MKSLTFVAVAVIVAAGCSRQSQTVASNPPSDRAPTEVASAGASSATSTPLAPDRNSGTTPTSPTPTITKPRHNPDGSVDLPIDPKGVEKNLEIQRQQAEKATQIPSQGTDEWSPSSVNVVELGRQLDASISGMKGVLVDQNVVVENPDGGRATGGGSIKIQSDKAYSVPFIIVGDTESTCNIVSNGKVKMEQIGDTWHSKVPEEQALTDSITDPDKLATSFDRKFFRIAFQPITDHKNTWAALMQAWANGAGGYHITVEERWLSWKAPSLEEQKRLKFKQYFSTYRIKQYRVHAIRDQEAALNLGQSEIEIVIDDMHKAPVTIRARYTDPSGKRLWKVEWGAAYHFNRSFTAEDFKAPYDMKPPKPGAIPTAVAG